MEEIKVENQSSVSRKISINLPLDVVNKKFDEFYNNLKDKVVLKGYRKSHIPRSILESYYGTQAKSTVSQSLFTEYFTKALSDNAITPASTPQISDVNQAQKIVGKFDASGYSVDVFVEVMPKIDASGYKEMTLKFPTTDIPKLVEEKIRELQDRFAERRGVDRGAQPGDCAIVDFIGTIDGQAVKGLNEDGFTINKLGTGLTVVGFDDALMGLKAGETKEFDITFPDKYVGNLGGKTAHFKATLQNLIEVNLAEVNDELALMAGHNTMEELRKELEAEAITTSNKINRGNLELQVISKLAKQNQIEIPEGAVQQEKNRILADLNARKVQTNPQIIANIEASARYNLARTILATAIYDKETSLEITPDELDRFLTKHAEANGKAKDEFVSLLYNAKQMDSFMNQLKTEKVLDFIITQARPEEEVKIAEAINENKTSE